MQDKTKVMKTFHATPSDVDQKWTIIDAEGLVVGRLAAIIAKRLMGKHLPTYTPSIDCGERIIVINADKVSFSGKKLSDKVYYWHTGYPGGIKDTTAGKILNGKFPERVLEYAVKRMLPKGKLGNKLIKNVRIYTGSEHPHASVKPEVLDVKSMNSKNTR